MISVHRRIAVQRQRGIATLLILLMIGLSLTAAILGSVHHLRVTQEQSVSIHAQTQAQARAWAAAEVTRQYFELLRQDADEWAAFYAQLETALAAGDPLALNLGMDDVTAQITRSSLLTTRTEEGEVPHITVVITATAAENSRAMSSSTLELMYAGAEPSGGELAPHNSAINFYGGLNLTGGIDIIKDDGDTTPYEVNVIGDVTIGSVSIVGADVIRSTGSVTIGGGTTFFREIYANCDISISSATISALMHATRHICFNGTNSSNFPPGISNQDVEVRANGSVILDSNTYGNVFALAGKGGHSQCSVGARQSCVTNPSTSWIRGVDQYFGTDAVNPAGNRNAAGNFIGGVYGMHGAGAGVIKSNANIQLQGTATVRELHAEGSVSLDWTPTIHGFVQYGVGLNAPSAQFINQNVAGSKNQPTPGYAFDLSPALPVHLETEVFDVKTLRSMANYIFTIDGSGNRRVSIKNVKNTETGQVISLENGYLKNMDWVCPALASDDNCIRIGLGYGNGNNTTLIAYNAANDRWVLNGTSLAPGIAYFEGNVELGSGDFYNTVLATKNITTSGSFKIYAPNFAGYSGYTGKTKTIETGICNNKYFKTIPTQFCKADGTYNYSAASGIGNYALMAGSCADSEGGCSPDNYVGGNIATGSSANVFGAVKAGNHFSSSGNTTVHGYITALGQQGGAPHSLGAKTTVDLSDLPPGYDPSGGRSVPGEGEPGTAGGMDIRWSRYL